MSDSDDDMPPPLEDMTDQIALTKAMKEKASGGTFGGQVKTEDHVEEIRLAPKQPQGGIAPKDDNFDFDKKKETSSQQIESSETKKEEAPVQKKAAAPKKNNDGFGGMAAGFLNGPPKKKKAAPAPKKIEKVEIEDQTHIKAKSKEDKLKIDEVQDAMTGNYEKAKQDWLTPEFFQKLATNPKLLKAFQNPKYMKAMEEFGKNPQEAMKKYGDNPEFRELMAEFSGFMGDHFGTVADKKAAEAEAKKKEEEEQIKSDPVFQTIQSDSKVQEYLKDPEVQEILQHLRFKGGLDLHQIMRDKPQVGQKMMFLINKGVLNTSSTL